MPVESCWCVALNIGGYTVAQWEETSSDVFVLTEVHKASTQHWWLYCGTGGRTSSDVFVLTHVHEASSQHWWFYRQALNSGIS